MRVERGVVLHLRSVPSTVRAVVPAFVGNAYYGDPRLVHLYMYRVCLCFCVLSPLPIPILRPFLLCGYLNASDDQGPPMVELGTKDEVHQALARKLRECDKVTL